MVLGLRASYEKIRVSLASRSAEDKIERLGTTRLKRIVPTPMDIGHQES